jgi:hypothetical protein
VWRFCASAIAQLGNFACGGRGTWRAPGARRPLGSAHKQENNTMKKILLAMACAFAFTTIGASVARAGEEGDATKKEEKAPAKKGKKAKKADEKKEDAK